MSNAVSEHSALVYGETFRDRLHGMLRTAPWWLTSFVIHFGILTFAWFCTWEIPIPQDEVRFDTPMVENPILPPVITREMRPREEERESAEIDRAEEERTDIREDDLPKIDIESPSDAEDEGVLTSPDGVTPQGPPKARGFNPGDDDLPRRFKDPEFLRILSDRALAVWLFDESRSMKDDQQVVRQKVDEIYRDVAINIAVSGGYDKRLYTAVCSYGQDFRVILRKPTADLRKIKRAIQKIPIDMTGKENYLTAINGVLNNFTSYARRYRRHLVIILVTDEGGDDDSKMLENGKIPLLEVTLARLKRADATLLVFGTEAGAFGMPSERIHDPTAPKKYRTWGTVNRGIETGFAEMFRHHWHFRHTRRVASGFGPYGMSRLCRETGGTYHLLRSSTAAAYDYKKLLAGYQPELASRFEIARRNRKNKIRRVIMYVVQEWANIHNREGPKFRYLFRNSDASKRQIVETITVVNQWINLLSEGIKRLDASANVIFEHSPRHWEANRDLMRAQFRKLRFQLYQYKLAMRDVGRRKNIPPPGDIGWGIHPTGNLRLRGSNMKVILAEKKMIEGLYKEVIERHAGTPWAVFALKEMRGLAGWAIRPYSRWRGGGVSKPPLPL